MHTLSENRGFAGLVLGNLVDLVAEAFSAGAEGALGLGNVDLREILVFLSPRIF